MLSISSVASSQGVPSSSGADDGRTPSFVGIVAIFWALAALSSCCARVGDILLRANVLVEVSTSAKREDADSDGTSKDVCFFSSRCYTSVPEH